MAEGTATGSGAGAGADSGLGTLADSAGGSAEGCKHAVSVGWQRGLAHLELRFLGLPIRLGATRTRRGGGRGPREGVAAGGYAARFELEVVEIVVTRNNDFSKCMREMNDGVYG